MRIVYPQPQLRAVHCSEGAAVEHCTTQGIPQLWQGAVSGSAHQRQLTITHSQAYHPLGEQRHVAGRNHSGGGGQEDGAGAKHRHLG